MLLHAAVGMTTAAVHQLISLLLMPIGTLSLPLAVRFAQPCWPRLFRSLSRLPPVDPELLHPVEGSSPVALSSWLAISIVLLSFHCCSFPSTRPPQGEYSSCILCDLLSSFFRLTFLIRLEGPDVGDFLRPHMLVHLTIKRTVYFSNTNGLLQSRSNNLIQMVFAFMQYLETFLEEQSQQ